MTVKQTVRVDALVARAGVPAELTDGDRLVTSVVHDSREVTAGSMFFCVRGERSDGHDFVDDALAAGAGAIVCDRPVRAPGVAVLRVADVREAIGPLCSAFFGEPSRRLAVFGVTGTNGKTTTVHLITSVLGALGWSTRSIGTLTGERTTPEAPQLQALFAEAVDHRAAAVAVEVSSHALAQRRVDGTRFAAVAFTNLTPDHLDFHGTMQDYFDAKRRLFTAAFTDTAVIDVDGAYGAELAAHCELPRIIHSGAGSVEVLAVSSRGSRLSWRGLELLLPLGGRFNVANAAVAADMVATTGLPEPDIAAAFATVGPVPGRFELIEAGQPFTVVVDYAHTPDGLSRVLSSAREVAESGRVILVFGCGGDRDRAKRPLMGAEAERGADLVVVTSDNPRHEDPTAIADDVVSGMQRPCEIVLDRREAIGRALDAARPGDVVVVAGKGHETEQTIGDQRFPFDDRLVARALIEARFAA